jgi:antitoxin (DNA-binding transcriptional repressor) of toxin-antitoxin stability system
VTTVNMLSAKTHLSRLVDALESGDETEIIIARNGKPAAILKAFAKNKGGVRLGLALGKYPELELEAFNALDADIEKLFDGEDADNAGDDPTLPTGKIDTAA